MTALKVASYGDAWQFASHRTQDTICCWGPRTEEDREICGINPQKRWFLGSDTIQNFCTGTLFLPSFGVSDTMKPSIFFWEILMERDDWPGKFWRWGAMSTRLNDRDSEGLKKSHRCFFRWLLNQWEFQDPKIEVLYHIRPYFVGTFPYIGLT